MSPPPATSGPRDENDAVNGAGASKTIVEALIVAVGLAVPAMYALIARPLALSTCTLGTKWKSAFSELSGSL